MIKFLTSLFLLIFLVSCKKDKKENQPINQNGVQEITPESFDGDFILTRHFSLVTGSVIPTDNFAQVYFSDSLFKGNDFGTINTVNGGTVFLNGIQLKGESFPNYYHYLDTTLMNVKKPCTWKVIGNNRFPTFSYQDHSQYPKYSGFLDLPDTLSCMGENEIKLTDYDAESATISIESVLVSGIFYKRIDTLSNSIKLKSSVLAQIGIIPGPAYFSLRFHKTNFKRIGSKVYRFTSISSYHYYVEIID